MKPSALLLCCLAGPLFAQQTAPPGPQPAPAAMPDFGRPHVAYEKYTLPNGLQVILVPDHRVPKVFVD